MLKFFRKLRKNEKGATAIEYGLIAALIAVGCIAALGLIGEQLGTTFGTVGTKLTEANAKASATPAPASPAPATPTP